jgi:hypothetical protein
LLHFVAPGKEMLPSAEEGDDGSKAPDVSRESVVLLKKSENDTLRLDKRVECLCLASTLELVNFLVF